MQPAGFEPEIPANERLQIYAIDGAATGIGTHRCTDIKTYTNLALYDNEYVLTHGHINE
jgi:hypothetical protein